MASKKSQFTAGRYRLLLPCHPHRPEEKSDSSSGDGSGKATPLTGKPSVPLQSGSTRLKLPNVSNPNVANEVDIIKQYLKDTAITTNMHDMTQRLLQLEILPYNPYPGYIRRFRRLAEKFHLLKESLHNVKHNIDCESAKLGDTVLFSTVTKANKIWGLEHVVSHVNPQVISGYYEPVLSATVNDEKVSQEINHHVSILVSLSGPCVFNGSVCQDWAQIELKVGIAIQSQDLSVAAKYFSLAVIGDLRHIELSKKHHLLDLTVPVEDEHGWISRSFSRSDIESIVSDISTVADEVKRLLVHAVMSKKRIVLNFLLCQTSKSSASKSYFPAVKTYSMLFLQTPASSQGSFQTSQPKLMISTLPFQALHEGVFLDQSQAEQYLSIFQKYYNLGGQPQPTAGKQRGNKINPMHPDMIAPIIKAWQMKVASLVIEHSLFLVIHYLFLLTLAQTRAKTFSKQTEKDLAIQISRVYRGTGAKLKSASFYHPVILQLLSSSQENVLLLADRMIAKYKDLLLQVADPELSTRSSETQSLKHLIEWAIPSPQNGARFHSTVLRSHLEELNDVVSGVVLGFSEDAVEFSAAVRSAKQHHDSLFPHLVQKHAPLENPDSVQHGVKNSAWINVDKMKINKRIGAVTSQAPKSVASHLAMLQYCADVRIDEVWKAFFENLLLTHDHLPPNPNPILVSHLRKANASVQSFFETDLTAAKRLIQRKIVPLEGSKELMTVSGSNAFAPKLALTLMGPLGYRQMHEIAGQVLITPPGEAISGQPISVGPFQVACCGALLPPTIHFGNVSPYLKSVIVDEHCFIRGPVNNTHEAGNVLAKTVLSHLQALSSRGILPYQAVFGRIVLKLNNLPASSATRFASEFSAAVDGKQVIDIELFYPLEWRYIHVKKRLLPYYVTDSNDRVAPLFRYPEESEDFRCSSIFLHPADARFCIKQIPVAVLSQDVATARYWQLRDWQSLVTHLTCRVQHALAEGANVKRNASILVSGAAQSESNCLLSFCWRYHSGIPGQIDYLRCLNSAIQSVMSFGVEATEEGADVSTALDQVLLEKMIIQLKWKMNDVVSQDSCLAPTSLSFLLASKMDVVAFRDPSSNALFVKYDRESIQILREVNGYLLAIRNATAQDLIVASSTVLQYVKSHSKPTP